MANLTPETLAELRRDAEAWLMIGGERVLPLLDALDVARAERVELAAELAYMTKARVESRAEVERLTAQIEAAKRIGLGTHLGRPWASVLNDVLRALDATPETGGES